MAGEGHCGGPDAGLSDSVHRYLPDKVTANLDGDVYRRGHEFGSYHDHIALLYANQEEQFEAIIPLIHDGLNRGDRCYYVYNDNTKSEIVAAMQEAGIDTDAAIEAGDLSFHAPDELFFRSGTFDPVATIADTKEIIREVTEENGYDTIRMVGEMTWVLDGTHSLDRMIEYEKRLNSVYEDRPVIGLCQYNVTHFEPEIINQLIRAHPNLVYGGAAARHFYYLPYEDSDPGELSRDTDSTPSGQSLLERVRAYETLERRERAVHALNEATQELMYLPGDEIAERAADIVRDVLDVTFASFWSYSEETGDLERLSSSSVNGGGGATIVTERYTDRAWNTFVSEETEVLTEIPSQDGSVGTETQLRSGAIVPLGRHGVFCAGSTNPNEFDEPVIDLARTVGSNIEAALDRADRESRLQEQNEQLERLNRINRVIREIDEALVDSTTQTEIKQFVCERLTTFEPYQFAWIGEADPKTDTIVPSAQAGAEHGYLETITITIGETPSGLEPVTAALKSREVQVVQDVLTEPGFKPWREATLAHEFRACASIPLNYEESVYGVLTLYTETPNSFDDLEITVLGELGETIAHAIDAAETRRTLRTDSVTEVTLEVRESDDVLAQLARKTGCEIDFDGIVPQTEGPANLFFVTCDITPDDVFAGSERVRGIGELQLIKDEGGTCVFEGPVTKPPLASRIIDHGAVIRSLSATEDVTTAVVDLPPTTDVREFVETIRTWYPNTELSSLHTRDRPIKTRQDLRDVLADQLTERQREIIETAYRSGYFESPRVRTGNELSEALDITQSTFSHHLREAERRLCNLVFENV